MTERLPDLLHRAAASGAAVHLIDDAETERVIAYRQLLDRARLHLARLQAAGARPGDEVILYVKGLEAFLNGFWAAVLGGMVPVPVAVGNTDEHRRKLLRIFGRLRRPWVWAERAPLGRAAELGGDGGLPEGSALQTRTIDAEAPPGPAPATPWDGGRASDTALIQFSSGSTGQPKGVVLTHANLLSNLRAIRLCARPSPSDTALGWMPLTHDMGLIGFHLTPLAAGIDQWLMPTDLFVRRPTLWLDKVAEHRITFTCSPNFGLRHYLNAAQRHGHSPPPLDCVRLIFNGAEPISVPLAREFLAYLAPARLDPHSMFPVYGLAEASLAVSFPTPGAGLQAVEMADPRIGVGERVRRAAEGHGHPLACLGTPVQDCELRIVDGSGRPLPAETVGHIQIRGGNVTSAYYRDPEATSAAINEAGWLDTGDLGFLTQDCGLVVTGRAKEIIFAHGQNFYPQDLEALLERELGLRSGRVAVAPDRRADAEDDTLLVFVVHRAEPREIVPLARQIHGKLVAHTGLEEVHVVPVPRLPKTTSGKLQRLELVRQYRQGAFERVEHAIAPAVTAPETDAEQDVDIAARLQALCREVMPDRPVGMDDNLFEIGTSSLELARLHEAIETAFPGMVDVTDLFDYPTIRSLAGLLEKRLSSR